MARLGIQAAKELLELGKVNLSTKTFKDRQALIKGARNRLAHVHHPDKFTNEKVKEEKTQLMTNLNNAADELLKHFHKDFVCPKDSSGNFVKDTYWYTGSRKTTTNTNSTSSNSSKSTSQNTTNKSTGQSGQKKEYKSNNSQYKSNTNQQSRTNQNSKTNYQKQQQKSNTNNSYSSSNKSSYKSSNDYGFNTSTGGKKKYSKKRKFESAFSKKAKTIAKGIFDGAMGVYENVIAPAVAVAVGLGFIGGVLAVGNQIYQNYKEKQQEEAENYVEFNLYEENQNLQSLTSEVLDSKFDDEILDGKYSALSEEEKLELLEELNTKFAEHFGFEVNIVYVETQAEKDQKMLEWQQFVSSASQEEYTREFYVYVDEDINNISRDNHAGTALAYIDLLATYIEEDYREKVANFEQGTLADNIMFASDSNYSSTIAKIDSLNFFLSMQDKYATGTYQTFKEVFVSALNGTANQSDYNAQIGGNSTLTLSELIELDFEKRLEQLGLDLTQAERNNNMHYNSMKRAVEMFETMYSSNPRYVDYVNGQTITEFPEMFEEDLAEFNQIIGSYSDEEMQSVEAQRYLSYSVNLFYTTLLTPDAEFTSEDLLKMEEYIDEKISYLTPESIAEEHLEQALYEYQNGLKYGSMSYRQTATKTQDVYKEKASDGREF